MQFHIDGRQFRTYTPFGWDGRSVSFLAYRHGDGPATTWLDQLQAGGTVHMIGPRSSLRLADVTEAPIVVGDETSFAVAAAWDRHGALPAAAHVFEVTAPDESRAVLDGLGLDGTSTLVARADDDGHHPALGALVVEAIGRHPGSPLVCTGKAQTIRAVRGAVKDAGLAPPARVKAYWDPRRSGLD